MPDKPWLLLDVDGPLRPWPKDPRTYPKLIAAGYVWDSVRHDGTTYPLLLNPAHGPALLALTDVFELAWATSWNELANEFVGPRLGLPRLPVAFVHASLRTPNPRLSFKTDQLAAWTAGRAFAWVDDEVNQYDRRRLAGDARVGPCLVRRIEEHRGLHPDDFAALRAWAEELDTGADPSRR